MAIAEEVPTVDIADYIADCVAETLGAEEEEESEDRE